MVSTIEVCGIKMFDTITRQLNMQTLGRGRSDFTITNEEFEQFCKEFLFEQLKDNNKLGDAFCKKYNESNSVLSILSNDSAKEHIKKFYVK